MKEQILREIVRDKCEKKSMQCLNYPETKMLLSLKFYTQPNY